MRWYNAAMKEALHMLAGPVIFVFWFRAVTCLIMGLKNRFRAAANRKPGISWFKAISFKCVMINRDLFTEEGEKAIARVRLCILGFITCWALGFLTGWLTGWVH
jgi:hypothetical protein